MTCGGSRARWCWWRARPEQVASAVRRALLHPTREIILPPVSGKMAAIGAAFPQLVGILQPILDRIGRRRRNRFKATPGEKRTETRHRSGC